MAGKDLVTTVNKAKGTSTPVGVPFALIKNKILGAKYDLSISFLSPTEQKKINKKYRGKDNTTNVLSFPLSKISGEITFDLALVRKEAPDFDMTYSKFLKYLFIHGCLHLKGFKHSSTMERLEKKYLKMFS
ncbi:MAG: rRNA maturation RNase YbeY [Patescibacteria group bacterium]